jgi:undecaprenyl-diphosphatase
LPAGILGFLANDFITEVFRSPVWVIIMLVVVAIVFILVERYARAEQDLKSLNFSRALLIGLAQCLALIPGVSRSGITIAAAMGVKIKRAEAARYSFLLAIPTILGASVSELATIASQGTSTNNIIKLGIGLVICFVFSFYVI